MVRRLTAFVLLLFLFVGPSLRQIGQMFAIGLVFWPER